MFPPKGPEIQIKLNFNVNLYLLMLHFSKNLNTTMISTSGQFTINITFNDQAQRSGGTLKKTQTRVTVRIENCSVHG